MLIDIHTHAYRIKPPLYGFCNLAELLKANERLGIDMAVVQPIVSPEIYIAQPSEDILEMAKQYPEYGFEIHKGYGTKAHYEALRTYGHCPLHRVTFLKKFYGDK